MAMPRRAMKDLGFQACCLRCDAPDEVGTDRCKGCITHHQRVRDEIAKAPQGDVLYQFARELLAMAANPNRYDNDEIHGPALIQQQRLANELSDPQEEVTSEDIEDIFTLQASQEKSNIVQTIGNQNPWKDELPAEEVLNRMSESLEAEDRKDGARTIPSRTIPAVDRSDRVGEDRKMVDRLAGEAAAAEVAEPLREVVETATIEERVRSREDWDETISEVSELLDDDLDL